MWFTKYPVTALILLLICFEPAFCFVKLSVPFRKISSLIPELKDAFKHSDDDAEYTSDNFEHTDGNRQFVEAMLLDKLAKNGENSDFYDKLISFNDIIDYFINSGSSKKENIEHLELMVDDTNKIVTSIYESFRDIASTDSEVWGLFDISDFLNLMEPTLRRLAKMAAMQKKSNEDMFDNTIMEDIINSQYEVFSDYLKNPENFAKFELFEIGYVLVCEQKMSTEVSEVLPKKLYDILKEISVFKNTTGISHMHLIRIAKFRLLYSFDVLLKVPSEELLVNVLRSLIEDNYLPSDFCS